MMGDENDFLTTAGVFVVLDVVGTLDVSMCAIVLVLLPRNDDTDNHHSSLPSPMMHEEKRAHYSTTKPYKHPNSIPRRTLMRALEWSGSGDSDVANGVVHNWWVERA